MSLCSLLCQAVMRRRDNIQAEFEAKNEALMSRKADQEAVSAVFRPHTLTEVISALPSSPLHASEPADVFCVLQSFSQRLALIK